MSRLRRMPLCPLEWDRVRGLDSQQPPFVDTLLLTSAGHSGQGPRRAGEGTDPVSALAVLPPVPTLGQSLCFRTPQGESSQRGTPRRPPATPTFHFPVYSPEGQSQGTLPEAALLLC